jgi:diguanylate cyclase (GGDEF)-like protein
MKGTESLTNLNKAVHEISPLTQEVSIESLTATLEKERQRADLAEKRAGELELELAIHQEKVRVLHEKLEINNEAHNDLIIQFEQISKDAYVDGLTGLYRREFFENEMDLRMAALHRQEIASMSLIVCDLDDFHDLNDKYGHDGGDAALKAIANILKEVSRGQDIPVRWGGDELAVLFTNTPVQKTRERAEIICNRINELELEKFGGMKITASVGSVSSEEIHTEPLTKEILFTAADKAVFESKRLGKNQSTSYSYIQKQAE